MEHKLFKKKKKTLLKNISILRNSLSDSIESGLADYGFVFYNQLEGLEEDIKASKEPQELVEMIEQAKGFEQQICALYENMGFSSTNLDWPDFEETSQSHPEL